MNAQPRGIPFRPAPDELARIERRALHRAITAMCFGVAQRQDPESILNAHWPDDGTATLMLRSVSTPTSMADYPAYTPTTMLPNLAPSSAAIKLFNACMVLDLSGVSSIRVPHTVTTPVPVFIPEGNAAPVVQFSLVGTTVGPVKKLLLMAAASRELQNATPGTASAVIGNVLNAAIAKSLDAIAFGTAAATSAQPAGLLNGVTPITATASTSIGGLAAMADDVGAMASAMQGAGIDPTGMIIVAAAKQATAMKLLAGPKFDYQVLSTLALPDKTIAGFAPGAIAAAFDGVPTIETSIEAALHFEDTTPLPISSVGTPSTIAAPVKSLFQHDIFAIKVRAKATWAVIAPGGVQYIQSVTW
jgi:hypothetical protein